jgi:hypothetical protein
MVESEVASGAGGGAIAWVVVAGAGPKKVLYG